MLTHSFVHIPGVGLQTERRFWESGLRSMHDFLHYPPDFLSLSRQQNISVQIRHALQKLADRDAGYFSRCLPSNEQWRIFREYRNSTAYIDIETTGLGNQDDIITTIALYNGKEIKYYVYGQNLYQFIIDIQDYDVVVTYNGKTFDIPFIERFFDTKISIAHLDLRYILKSLGYTGGLKSCEKQFELDRQGCLDGVDGYFAVLLWFEYQCTGDYSYLNTLLAYNIQDVISLEHLMVQAYNKKIEYLPLDIEPVQVSSPPLNPCEADVATIRAIQNKYLT